MFFTHIRSRRHLRKLWFIWAVSERKTLRERKDGAAKPDSLFAAVLIMISTECLSRLNMLFLNAKKNEKSEDLQKIKNVKTGIKQ